MLAPWSVGVAALPDQLVQVGQPIPYGAAEPDEGRGFPPRRQPSSVAIATPSTSATSFSRTSRSSCRSARCVQVLATPLEGLFADHGAPIALHRGVVGGDQLRR